MPRARSSDPHQKLEKLILKGDVAGVLNHMAENYHLFEFHQVMESARKALGVAMVGPTEEIIELAYRSMIIFSFDLLFLSQLPLCPRLNALEGGDPNEASHARAVLEQQLPYIQRLHNHLVALTKAYATTTHTLRLANGDEKASPDLAPVLKLVADTERLNTHNKHRARA